MNTSIIMVIQVCQGSCYLSNGTTLMCMNVQWGRNGGGCPLALPFELCFSLKKVRLETGEGGQQFITSLGSGGSVCILYKSG